MKPSELIDLRAFEHKLAIEMSRLPEEIPVFSQREHRYEGWLICPRAHALKYGFRVPAFPSELMDRLTTEGWPIYDRLRRAHSGDDLVFAIGDVI